MNVPTTTALADRGLTTTDRAIGIPAVRRRTVAETSRAVSRTASAPEMTAAPVPGDRRDLATEVLRTMARATETVRTTARRTCRALLIAGLVKSLLLAGRAINTARSAGASRARIRAPIRVLRKGRRISFVPVGDRRWGRLPSPVSFDLLTVPDLAGRMVPSSADRRPDAAVPIWSGD